MTDRKQNRLLELFSLALQWALSVVNRGALVAAGSQRVGTQQYTLKALAGTLGCTWGTQGACACESNLETAGSLCIYSKQELNPK